MGMAAGRTKLKSFYILKILSERTDDEHMLNASQIMDLLKSEYGITVNRQTVYSEIDKLQAAVAEAEPSGYIACLLELGRALLASL